MANEAERQCVEAVRRIKVQGSLVEVLVSERLVFLGENTPLEFGASAAEEDVVAAAELGYTCRRAAEMTWLVEKLQEDHNRECYKVMAK